MRSMVIGIWCMCMVALAEGQADPSVWNSEIKAENNQYVLNLPDQWKKVALPDGSGIDYKYEFAGVGIPATVGGSALNANFTIAGMPGNKHNQAMDQCIADFSSFYDRVTEPGYNYDTTTTPIQTSQVGTVLHTRYYRRSKVSNYSKYYLVIYSPKADETYILTLSFQYKDPSYDIERSGHFNEYAMQVFGHFELR